MTFSDNEIIKELESWRQFSCALQDDDRDLFTGMLALCREYFPAMQAKGPTFETEALFVALMLMQHKEISMLASEMRKLKGKKDARLDS